jgi:(2Fe-2S) ferredoxin
MFYIKHIFFCCNRKDNGSGCGFNGSDDAFTFAKKYLKSRDLHGEDKIRVTRSGCLGRCELAPVCVIYPEGVWYSYVDLNDVEEILDSHLIKGNIVERLLLKNN